MSVVLLRGGRTRLVVALGAFALAAGLCADAIAETAPAPAAPPAAPPAAAPSAVPSPAVASPDASAAGRYQEIAAALASGNLEVTRTGLVRLRSETAQGQYLELLVGALERGGAEPVVAEALSVAELWAKPVLSASVAPYLKHRNVRVRSAAARALAKTGGPESVKALRLCLRAADAVLRETCVEGLGQLGDPIAVGDLFLALDRGLVAAAIAIGRLCDDAGCQKLADRLGKLPFEAMGQGLVEVVLRTDARVKSATKVELIARVANLRTAQAASLLRGAKSRFPAKGDRAVANALDSAIESFGGK